MERLSIYTIYSPSCSLLYWNQKRDRSVALWKSLSHCLIFKFLVLSKRSYQCSRRSQPSRWPDVVAQSVRHMGCMWKVQQLFWKPAIIYLEIASKLVLRWVVPISHPKDVAWVLRLFMCIVEPKQKWVPTPVHECEEQCEVQCVSWQWAKQRFCTFSHRPSVL